MRKIVMLVISMCLIAVVFVACSKPDPYVLIKENMCDFTQDLLVGSDANFDVAVTKGKREEKYILDGKCGAKAMVFNVKVMPKNMLNVETVAYKITVKNKDYQGVLAKNKVGNSFENDLKKDISTVDGIKIVITCEGKDNAIELKSVRTKEMLAIDDVIKKFEEKFKTDFDEMKKDSKKYDGEIVFRIVKANADESDKYYWYCAISRGENKIKSALIDMKTGDILASRG